MSIKVLITAGGTVEAIDDVRTFEMRSVSGNGLVTFDSLEFANISKGGFGRAIAEAFIQHESFDFEVTMLARYELYKRMKNPPKGLTVKPFRSFDDLHKALKNELETVDYDIVLMAAAVSDYSPVRTEGKISSSDETLVMKFKRNPKLLSRIREWCDLDHDVTIVGFKLLSNVSTEKLLDVANKQNQKASLDLTVANDMQKIDWENSIHPIELVDREGKSISIEGKREYVARALVEEIIEYQSNKFFVGF